MQIKLLTMSLFLLIYLLAGCASVGNEARIMPAPDTKWKYASGNYLRDNMVEYDCSNFKISVWEVPIRSKTYFIGPIIPIIPLFYGLEHSQEDLEITVATTNNIELSRADLSNIVIHDEKLKVHDGSGYKTYGTVYSVVFDIPRDSTSGFRMSFPKPIQNCIVPPLDFKLSDKTGLRFWKPGP